MGFCKWCREPLEPGSKDPVCSECRHVERHAFVPCAKCGTKFQTKAMTSMTGRITQGGSWTGYKVWYCLSCATKLQPLMASKEKDQREAVNAAIEKRVEAVRAAKKAARKSIPPCTS